MTVIRSPSESTSNWGLFQNSFYIGINLENILYGIELFLYFKTMWILWPRRACKKSNIFYMVFSSAMLFLVTVWVVVEALFGEKMWILDAPFPGGPDEYWNTKITVWYMDFGLTSVILLQLLTDALMIYRCRIVFNSHRVIIIPIMLWLAGLALGFMLDWVSSSPGGDIFTGLSAQLGFAYYTVSVTLNTSLTVMICYRMMQHAKAVQQCIGYEYASLYFSVIALIVESMFPYTISGIAFLITFGIGSSTSIAFISVYILMMCLSPQMLILRVSMGMAWDNDTFRQPDSTLRFNPASTELAQSSVTGRRKSHLQQLSNVYLPDGSV